MVDASQQQGAADDIPGEKWPEVLNILSSLIQFKSRADAKNWREALDNMVVYLERLGLTEDVQKLNVIHVAGTKGKGSTCAMVESILRQCGYRTGLFTSPHLVDVRERIRIDGRMVSHATFERCFWELHRRFQATATPEVGVPGYFRFLTLLALRAFLEQQVDVVVLEVGIGGRLDATNVISQPIAAAITSLGYDHMDMLGDTLEKIAGEKAGILKPGRPGLTVQQQPEAMAVLQETARQVGAPLQVVQPLDSYRSPDGSPLTSSVALGGTHQHLNAALALQLAAAFEREVPPGRANPGAQRRLQQLSEGVVPEEYVRGLAGVAWPGRSQVVHDDTPGTAEASTTTSDAAASSPSSSSSPLPSSSCSSSSSSGSSDDSSRLSFFIDGAHTPESMVTCADWFADVADAQIRAGLEVQRVLLFNCMKERDPALLLPYLHKRLRERGVHMHAALFVPPLSQYSTLQPSSSGASKAGLGQGQPQAQSQPPPNLEWQSGLRAVWEKASLQQGLQQQQGGEAGSSRGLMVPCPGQAAPLQDLSRGAVLPSLACTLDWLRDCVRSKPRLQLQVLVTGSLYLVGDVLKLLQKAPK